VRAILVCALAVGLGACGDDTGPTIPEPEEPLLACQELGPHCDGDSAVRCEVDEPDPLEKVLGVEPRTYQVRADCASGGMQCRSRADAVECAYPACGGIVELSSDPLPRVDVRFAREEERSSHGCVAGTLGHEEVIIELVGGTDVSTPSTFWVSPLAAGEVALVYDEAPCADSGTECWLADRDGGTARVTVDPGEVRYLVIDSAADPDRIGEERNLSITRQQCGDGFRSDGEECDDGDLDDGDGCDSSCRREPGYMCRDWLSASECAYMISTCSIARTFGVGEIVFDTAWGRDGLPFGSCAPADEDYFVVFEVEVPAGHRLAVTAPGEVRIGESCAPLECVSDDGSFHNDTGAPVAVKVWTSAASSEPGETTGTATIALAP
jgi:cysteine-rich repeat protein